MLEKICWAGMGLAFVILMGYLLAQDDPKQDSFIRLDIPQQAGQPAKTIRM